MSPHGRTQVPRVGQLCLGTNVPCGQICLGIIVRGQWCLGTSVRGTAVPRYECPRGHFAGAGTTMPTTPEAFDCMYAQRINDATKL